MYKFQKEDVQAITKVMELLDNFIKYHMELAVEQGELKKEIDDDGNVHYYDVIEEYFDEDLGEISAIKEHYTPIGKLDEIESAYDTLQMFAGLYKRELKDND